MIQNFAILYALFYMIIMFARNNLFLELHECRDFSLDIYPLIHIVISLYIPGGNLTGLQQPLTQTHDKTVPVLLLSGSAR